MRAGQAANSGWPDSKCSVLGAHMALLSFDAAKVRRFHCGGRIFRGFFSISSRFFLRGHVVMMVMVKMVKIEMEKKEKCSIIYNIYIFIYYSIKIAFPKIDFDQNDHDHFDHDTGAAASKFGFGRKMCHMVPGTLLHGGNNKSANLRSCKKPTICRMDGDRRDRYHFVATPHTRRESFRCACVSYCRFIVTKRHSFRVWHLCCMMWGESRKAIERK